MVHYRDASHPLRTPTGSCCPARQQHGSAGHSSFSRASHDRPRRTAATKARARRR
ncbi:hypothetical protein PHLGIDRAFT_164682 [Phlebiopsis gigantea 11061_1 CR5-6]|uniref:Uncharacterized protein n=1 Tax=Phlebiopsis gigantea (strain 11061_1 CR5-6) TaxID=745531 RepID=A0A0C3NJT1_PHLG1|nr:hypothetical protein PHLGIDRAFT_164682 [Phlebiopsis gigantea 11061_1 CR5-6]